MMDARMLAEKLRQKEQFARAEIEMLMVQSLVLLFINFFYLVFFSFVLKICFTFVARKYKI